MNIRWRSFFGAGVLLLVVFLLSFSVKPAHAQVDDIEFMTFSPKSLTYKYGDSGTATFKIVLPKDPTAPLTLTVEKLGLSKAPVTKVSPETLTFDSSHPWNKPQTVTLTYDPAYKLLLTGSFVPGISYDGTVTVSGKSTEYTGIETINVTGTPPSSAVDPSAPTDSATSNSLDTAAGFKSSLSALLNQPGGFVQLSWSAVRSIINILLIIALLVISFSNITRINLDTYTIKKALPNLVIGVILANASFLIIKYMADIATVTTYLFVNLSNAGSFQAMVHSVSVLVTGTSLATLGLAGAPFDILVVFVLGIISIIILLWWAFILYLRLVAIYLLAILSPLAFVAYGIPGLEKYFKQWWQQFIKWLFILPAMAAIFWLVILITSQVPEKASIARLLITYILVITALQLPSKMGGAIVDKATKAFRKYTGVDAAQKFANEQVGNAGKWTVSRIPGAYRIQEWNKLRKQNFEKDLENRRAAAAVNASSGRAGLRQATLAYQNQIVGNRQARMNAQQSTRALTSQLAKQLNQSEFQKTSAEKLKEIAQNTRKMEYYTQAAAKTKDAHGNDVYLNPEMKAVIDEFAKANSQASALTEAVGTEEKKANGAYTNKRLDALAALEEHASLQKEVTDKQNAVNAATAAEQQAIAQFGNGSAQHLATRNARATAIAELRTVRQTNRPLMANAANKFNIARFGHEDLQNLTIDQASTLYNDGNDPQGAIWKAEKSKQVKSYNGGIDAMTEDMRKNGSVHILTNDKDNKGFHDGTHANIQELASNNAINVGMGEQDKFQKYVYTLKDWMRSNRNPNYRDAIKASLSTFVEHGGQVVDSGSALGPIDAGNVGAAIALIDTLNQEELSKIVSGINRLDAFGGDPGRHINHVNR